MRSARSSWLASAESHERSDWASEASSSTSVGPCSRKPSSSSTKAASTSAGVGAGRDVEHDEAEGGAVDEPPGRGVRPERGLLAPHEPADEPRGGEATDAVDGHGGGEELVGLVDGQAERDVEPVVGHGLAPVDAHRLARAGRAGRGRARRGSVLAAGRRSSAPRGRTRARA